MKYFVEQQQSKGRWVRINPIGRASGFATENEAWVFAASLDQDGDTTNMRVVAA